MSQSGQTEFILLSKWRCDGSGGQSMYKQGFNDPSGSDESVFMFSLVLRELLTVDREGRIWQNPVPGSTRFCRPINFMLEKETTETIVRETDLIKNQINVLRPTSVQVNGKEIRVTHRLLLTMVDGKVANALTATKSTQTCYLCNTTPTQLRKTSGPAPYIAENFSFGLSTLHACIRIFEFLLHISYRLELKKKTLSLEEKAGVSFRKSEIQKKFKEELGLNVDMPKQGVGNTNDGNTARKFFEHSKTSALITGLDEHLIERFGVILRTLPSKFDINEDKFEQYTRDTKACLTNCYPWFEMTPTVHKILDHSAQVVRHHSVPIGVLTEESQEARHKEFRMFPLKNTRKSSRQSTNLDLFSMLLVSSDPVVANYRKAMKQPPKTLDPEVAASRRNYIEGDSNQSYSAVQFGTSDDEEYQGSDVSDSEGS